MNELLLAEYLEYRNYKSRSKFMYRRENENLLGGGLLAGAAFICVLLTVGLIALKVLVVALISGFFMYLVSKTGWIKFVNFWYSAITAALAAVLLYFSFFLIFFALLYFFPDLFNVDTDRLINANSRASFVVDFFKYNWAATIFLMLTPAVLIAAIPFKIRSKHGLVGWVGYLKAVALVLATIATISAGYMLLYNFLSFE
jgi:hypothetical protein